MKTTQTKENSQKMTVVMSKYFGFLYIFSDVFFYSQIKPKNGPSKSDHLAQPAGRADGEDKLHCQIIRRCLFYCSFPNTN